MRAAERLGDNIVNHPKFKQGDLNTHFITENFSPEWVSRSQRDVPVEVLLAASLFDALKANDPSTPNGVAAEHVGHPTPWQILGSQVTNQIEVFTSATTPPAFTS